MVRAGAFLTNSYFFSPLKKNPSKKAKLLLDLIKFLISVGGNFSYAELWDEKAIFQE
jgi:hypothetical protein